MKTKLLSLALIVFTVLQINAQQCTEDVSDFGNNTRVPTYNVSGDVEVVFNSSNNSVTLNLASNYSTANGPDVRAYLINSNGMSDNQLRNARIGDLENVEFGLTNPSGADSFTISAPANIEDFDKVFFYCLQFNAFWDFGSFTPFTASNCAILSLNDTVFSQNLIIYPNPASNKITILGKNPTEGETTIFNMLGKKVFHSNGPLSQKIDVSNLNKGVYIITIKSQSNSASKQLIIQ